MMNYLSMMKLSLDDTKIVTQLIQTGLLAGLVFILSSCSQLSNFTIEPVNKEIYPATEHITVIEEEPDIPYITIARFSGTEKNNCHSTEPLCSIRKQAREIGADAIWVKQHEVYDRAGRWILVQGRMTQIYPYREVRFSGVLIHYKK